jgi:hypothetical protein
MVDENNALVPTEESSLVARDEQWLKPWQWITGLTPLWGVWAATELVRSFRGKAPLVPKKQERRMHFLQILATVGFMFVVGPSVFSYILLALLGLLVFVMPSRSTLTKILTEKD